MADYAPLLRRAIAALPDNSPEARQAIFARARTALERQLAGQAPALDEAEQLAIRLSLEDAIRAIEAEVAESPASSEPPSPAEATVAIAPPVDAPKRAPPAENVPPTGDRRIKFPLPAKERPKGRKAMLFAIGGFVALAGMGTLALSNREGPGVYMPATVTPAPADPGKREGRLTTSEAPSAPSAPAVAAIEPPRAPEPPAAPAPGNPPVPVTSEPVAPRQAAPPIEAAPLPVLSRSFMVVEVPGGAPNQFEGQADWKFVPEPGARNGARTLRLEVDFPAAGLRFDMTIARNSDPALGASHTVLVVFDPKAGFDAIREMSALEWRERETQSGTAFAGALVPMQDNVFLFGLDGNEAPRARNLDLLRNQRWLVFEFRLANSRRGVILVEKGSKGEAAIGEALAEWK